MRPDRDADDQVAEDRRQAHAAGRATTDDDRRGEQQQDQLQRVGHLIACTPAAARDDDARSPRRRPRGANVASVRFPLAVYWPDADADTRHAAAPAVAADVDAARALALGRRRARHRGAGDRRARSVAWAMPFVAAADAIYGCRGRVVVTGIGKSGHIARKLAATLASTGTPAFFVHAAEAGHGDLGMITADDVVLLLSNSGETDELVVAAPASEAPGRAG